MPSRRLPILFTIILLALPVAALAQGFGQNKVHYRKLDWSVIQTEHFEVYFYKGEHEAAVDAARMAERAYARLSTILHHQVESRIPLILYASQSDFQSTNVSPEMISEGTGGFTDFAKRRVTIPFTGGYGDLEHVLTHELVHAFQFDVLFGSAEKGIAGSVGGYTPPLWFAEGMAEYLSITKVDNLTSMWMRDAALQGYLISIGELEYAGDIRVYRFGQSIFAYIGKTFGDERIGELLERLGRTHNTARAFQDVLGMTMSKLSDDWMEDIRKTYLPVIRDHKRPEDFARRLTDSAKDRSSFHVAPAVSPQGDRMVFISDRTLYYDLYLASALDGRVERRLLEGERTEDFESLRFLNASIDFSPDGGEIVFAAKSGAHDAIYINRLRDGQVVKKLGFPLDGIVNPSFSPDGGWIVFTGLDGGRSDLFRCHTDGSGLERLTDDRFLDLSPRYSPDGKSIVFVTDQDSTTDFENLTFASPRLAILDIPTRQVHVMDDMPGMNTSPYYFPDGTHLMYISDRTGIANIYIRDLASGEDARITDILTGVTGIIPLAPALSLSRDGRRVVFSAFSKGSWDLFAIKDPLVGAKFEKPAVPPMVVEGTSTPADSARGEAHAEATVAERVEQATPTGDRTNSAAQQLVDSPTRSIPRIPIDSLAALPDTARSEIAFHELSPEARKRAVASHESERSRKIGDVFASVRALPDTSGFKVNRYRIHFTVDYARASGYFASNVGAAAQTTLSFSDVLGNHALIIGASIYGSIADSDFLFEYDNLANRINYGISLYQFRDDFFLSTAQANDNYVSEIYRGGQFMVSRPFDRFRRLELSLEALGVDESVYRQAFFGNYYTYVPAGQGRLYFVRPGISYVHDNALWGMTGPISGGRSRIALDQAFGDVASSRLVFDWRSYTNLQQTHTFAVRTVAATSAGPNPEVFRIGGPYTLRGYPYGGLEGNHVALVNLEFRFPLIQQLEMGWPLPLGFRWIRGALFFDAGSVWHDTRRFRAVDPSPWRLRDVYASYGIGASMNFGFAVLRWDLARPTNLHSMGRAIGTISFGGDF